MRAASFASDSESAPLPIVPQQTTTASSTLTVIRRVTIPIIILTAVDITNYADKLTKVNLLEDAMNRIQLALNVSNLDEAVDFYSKFFRAEPAKRRPGYANFALDDPPLKLVLMEKVGEPGTINHLGVEVFSSDDVVEATKYLSGIGFATDVEDQTTCCYALQDKVWVDGPDGSRWEVYTVLADANDPSTVNESGECCAPATAAIETNAQAASSCC
jgi:catechol 2,3-dioxygenase-like lactoylglutathione lyase family enzyme